MEAYDGSTWHPRGKRYLRYYTASDPETAADGFVHGLKYYLGPEMYRQMEIGEGLPENVTDEALFQDYANYHFKYNPTTKRVKQINRKGEPR